MLRRVRSVAGSWTKRLHADPSHDVEDMVQELSILYWRHFLEHEAAPGELTVRRWAWDVMRKWGYKGRRGGDLKHGNMEVSFSRHPATREHDCTDEDLLDLANFSNQAGWRGRYDES